MPMPYLLVEYRYDPPVTPEQLAKRSAALTPCLELRGITWLRSWVASDGRRGVCEYRAADAESLREAYRSAGVTAAAIWSGTLFEPDQLPDEG
jgi:hypothetical protein